MIKARFQGKLVTGKWFLLGDSYWLLLTTKATKRTGCGAIKIDKLTKISEYPF